MKSKARLTDKILRIEQIGKKSYEIIGIFKDDVMIRTIKRRIFRNHIN